MSRQRHLRLLQPSPREYPRPRLSLCGLAAILLILASGWFMVQTIAGLARALISGDGQ